MLEVTVRLRYSDDFPALKLTKTKKIASDVIRARPQSAVGRHKSQAAEEPGRDEARKR